MSENKLARAGIAVGAAQDLRQALVPLLVILVVSGGAIDSAGEAVARFGLYGVLGLGLAVVMGYWRWITTWWSIGDGAVRLRTGLLESKVRTIPLDRLQSVDASQGPVQRLFGVQQLRLQAAGTGKEAEIVLLALDAAQVAEIRAALAGTEATDDAAPLDSTPAGPVWRLRPGMLLASGITSAQFGFLIPVAAAAGQAVDDISEPLIGHFREDGGAPAATEIALALLAIVTAAWLIAFAGTVIAFTGHRVERRRDRLIVMRGLFVRREASLPVARVQGVRLVDGLLRQPFGLTQIRVETAGYADERAYEQTLFPLLRRSDVPAFLGELLPELSGDFDAGLSRPPARAARRYVVPLAAAALVAGAAPSVALGPGTWWPLAVALVALASAYGLARYAAAGWSLDPVRLVVRERRIARHTVIARRSSVDIRSTRQNPWQRRARLADLRFAIASKRRFGVHDLDEAEANGAIAALAPS